MPDQFITDVLATAGAFPWIKRTDSRKAGKVARIRLWLNADFVDVYYNSQTGSTSYAYIQGRQRLFGANNMRIGWHVHPFGQADVHQPSKPLSISGFLRLLEKELKQRAKFKPLSSAKNFMKE